MDTLFPRVVRRVSALGLAVVLVVGGRAGVGVRADEPAGRGDSVEARVRALKSGDAKARAAAARALEAMGPRAKDAVPALVEALRDRDTMVRVRAASAVCRVNGVPTDSALVVLLSARNDPDDEARDVAEEAWARIGGGVRAALPYLGESLRRNDLQAQRKAVLAIEKNGLASVPALLDVLALEHTPTSVNLGIPGSRVFIPTMFSGSSSYNNQLQANTRLRVPAIEALGKLGPGAVPVLVAAAADRNAAVREGAVQALGLIEGDRAAVVPVLIRGLGDKDVWVRQRSVESLARAARSSPEARGALVEALRHQDTNVRRVAVQVFSPNDAARSRRTAGNAGMMVSMMMNPALPSPSAAAGTLALEPSMVPALVAALGDSDSYVRLKAAEALSKVTPPVNECVPELLDLLTDREAPIREAAADVLQGLGLRLQEIAPDLRRLQRASNPFVRVLAAGVLGRTGAEGKELALSTLRDALEDEEVGCRLKAAESLIDLGHADDAVPVLVSALGTRDRYDVMNQAGQILGRVGPANKELVPALVAALKDGDVNTRNQIIQVFQRIGLAARPAAPALVGLLTSKDVNLGNQTLQVLRQLGPLPREAAAPLLETFKTSDTNRRIQLAPLLAQLGTESKGAVPLLAEMLKDPNTRNRSLAVETLVQLAPSAPAEAIGALALALKDKELTVRATATRAIEQLGPAAEGAIATLAEIVNDPLPENRLAAMQALNRLGPRAGPAAPALARAVGDRDQRVSSLAGEILGRLGRQVIERHAPQDRAAVNDPDPAARAAALALLALSDPARSPESVAALVAFSKDSQQAIRLKAVQALGRLGTFGTLRDPTVVPALMERLEDPNMNVRLQAAGTLARAPAGSRESTAAFRSVLAALKDDRGDLRREAARILGELGARARPEIPALVDRLNDPDPNVRYQLAIVLSRLGPSGLEAAAPVLTEIADGEKPGDRMGAIGALQRAGVALGKKTVPSLLELVRSSNNLARSQAYDAIAQLGPPAREEALAGLAETLRSSKSEDRFYAAEALNRLGHDGARAAIPILVERLKDGDANSRSQTIYAFVNLPGADLGPAIPTLNELLAGSEPNSLSSVIQGLGRLGPRAKAVAPALRALLKDPNSYPRLLAAQALRQIGGADDAQALDVLVELVQDPNLSFRTQAAMTLAQSGPEGVKQALPVLLEGLTSAQRFQRNQALTALGRIRGPSAKSAADAVVGELDDPDPTYQQAVLVALGQMGTQARHTIPALASRLASGTDDRIRTGIVHTLGRMGPEAVPALAGALGTAGGNVRMEAIKTLGFLGPDAGPAAPALAEVLRNADTDADTRGAAVNALSAIGLDAVGPAGDCLSDGSAAVRRAAAQVLGRLGTVAKDANGPLNRTLNDREAAVRVAAAEALRLIDGEHSASATVPVLTACLKDTNVDVRRDASRTLAQLGSLPTTAVPELVAALKDADGMTRVRVAEALAHVPGHAEEAVAALIDAMAEIGTSGMVPGVLGQLGPVARGAMLRLVDELDAAPGAAFSEQLADAIARIGGAAAVEHLVRSAAEADLLSRPAIVSALALTGPSAIEPLDRILAGGADRVPEQATRLAVVRAIARLGTDRGAEILIRLLHDPDAAVRTEAAIGLASIRSDAAGEAIPILVTAATEGANPSRLNAIEALGRLGPAALPAVPALSSMMTADGPASGAAVQSLGRIGPAAREALVDLRRLMSDPDPRTRARAAVAAWDVGHEAGDALDVLIEALHAGALPPGSLLNSSPLAVAPALRSVVNYTVTSSVPVPALTRDDRRAVIEALGRMKSRARAALPALGQYRKDPDESIRRAAAAAIDAIDPKSPEAP